MKRLLLSMFLTMVLLTPVMAKADVGVSSNDLSSVFNESTTGNELVASALSLQEMEETEGAIAPYLVAIGVRAGYGATAGAVRYTVTNAGTANWRWSGLAYSTGYGALGGVIGVNRATAALFGTAASSAGMRWGQRR